MSREVAETFRDALWRLEEDRDVEPLVEVHAEDCGVGNIAVPRTFGGHDGLREFWTSYRATFDDMKSEFRNVFADDSGHAALEWTMRGTSNGKSVEYGSASILEIEGGKVKRFMAYFDPRELTQQVVS